MVMIQRGTDGMNIYTPKSKKYIYKFLYKEGHVWDCPPHVLKDLLNWETFKYYCELLLYIIYYIYLSKYF